MKVVDSSALIAFRWSDAELQEMFAIVTEFRLRQLLKAAQEKPHDYEQHERQRDLSNHQDFGRRQSTCR